MNAKADDEIGNSIKGKLMKFGRNKLQNMKSEGGYVKLPPSLARFGII